MKRKPVDPAGDESPGLLQRRRRQSSQQLPAPSGQPQHAPPEHALPQPSSGQQNLDQQQNVAPNQQQQPQRGGPVHGRRQPQTSCDSCRKRKLKCDRRQPCSSCVARCLPCHGQPNPVANAIDQSSIPSSTADAILRRICALEEAVFGGHQDQEDSRSHGDRGDHGDHPQERRTAETVWPRGAARRAEMTATEGLEEFELGHMATMQLGQLRNFKVGIAKHRVRYPLAFLGASVLELGVIWMMPRAAAAALLQDYLDHVYPLHPIVHGSTTRKLLGAFYDALARRDRLVPHTTAFILALAVVSAYFWQPDVGRHNYFASLREAAEASFVWRDWASDILVNTAQEPGTSTLEGVQAWVLLSFLAQTVEGASHRLRFLHSCSLTAARQLSFHVVDSPTKADPASRAASENHVTCELKRRIWWYIAATDWLLGFTGGPTEGTYSVQPRHMKVRYPKNANDDELATLDDSADPPLHRFTQMSYFLQRIRVAEIIRTVLDCSSPGDAGMIISDYKKVFELDRLFEQALSDLPPFFRLQDRLSPRRPDMVELQSVLVRLGLFSRRARLHRPSLLKEHSLHDESSFRKRSRDICLESSRIVVSLGIDIIQRSLFVDQPSARTATTTTPGVAMAMTSMGDSAISKTPCLSAHRLGLIVCHLSASCTVLAIYASGANNSKGGLAGETGLENGEDDEAEQQNRVAISHELAQACRILGALGTESPVAPDLLRNLVSLLNRCRVPPVHQRATPTVNGKNGESGGGTGKGSVQATKEEEEEEEEEEEQGSEKQQKHMLPQDSYEHQHYQQQQQQQQSQQQHQIISPSWTPVNQMGDGGQFRLPIADVIPQCGLPVDLGDDGGAPYPLSLDGLWDGVNMSSGEEYYSQLFANLDYYSGMA
ncbi:hypothetical protein VTH06DRAFT_4800 [Thermothelomyces fergusii]